MTICSIVKKSLMSHIILYSNLVDSYMCMVYGTDLATSHCPAVAAPSHGFLSQGTNPRSFGTVVTFGCKPGYVLQGSSSAKCLGDGSWSSPAPKCTGKWCLRLTVLCSSNLSDECDTSLMSFHVAYKDWTVLAFQSLNSSVYRM